MELGPRVFRQLKCPAVLAGAGWTEVHRGTASGPAWCRAVLGCQDNHARRRGQSEGAWCRAGAMTGQCQAPLVVEFGGAVWSGIRIGKHACCVPAYESRPKRCGRCARIFCTYLHRAGCNRELTRGESRSGISPDARPPEHPTAPSSTQLSGQVALQACVCGLPLPPAAPHAPRAALSCVMVMVVRPTRL